MARSNDTQPDPQHSGAAQAESALDANTVGGETSVDAAADDMAKKGCRTEKSNEVDDVTGGVRSNSGGIFSK